MKKFNSFLAIILVLALVLVGCGGKGEEDKTDDVKPDDGKLKIVAIVNGNLGDKSFFDSLEEGLKALEKEGYTTKVIETGFDETKWEPAIVDVSEEDWDVIIAGTWQMADHVSKVAEEYPDKKYIVYDSSVDFEGGKNSNVYTIEYKQNEGSFLAGAAAAELSESGILGYIGGLDIPVINDFLVGYIAGAQHVNPDIKVATSYIGNFEDTGRAKELGFAQFNLGVDIVFPAASIAGNGALEAAKDNSLRAIGVDSDQSLLYEEVNDEVMAELIITSVLKEVGNSIIRAIKLYEKDELPWGSGEVLGIEEGAIGIAKNKYYEKSVPGDVKELIEELELKIKSGEIEVPTSFGMTAEELNDLRNTLKP